MALGLKIGGEFLDVPPGTVMQLEESNPFLQLTDEVQGQYSLPVSVPMTEKNIRLLKFANLIQTRKENIAIPATLYDGNLQHSQGILKIEQINGDLNFSKNGNISLYYLYGISDFYQLVKDKRLPDIDYGVRSSFPFSYDWFTPGNLYNHFYQVMWLGTQDQWPYAIFEVNNPSDISPSIFNDGLEVDKNYNYTGAYTENVSGNPWNDHGISLIVSSDNKIVPFPYLGFTMDKIFSSVGWSLKGDVLSDPDFRKIVILHGQRIPATWYDETNNLKPGAVGTINLSVHMPNVTISGFLTALKSRLGWWYDFDYNKKICTIRFVKDVFSGRGRTDYSQNISSAFSLKINDKKTYTISATLGDSSPDWSLLNLKGRLAKFNDLPALAASDLNDTWFIAGENSWYSVQPKSDDTTTEWQKITGNTYGFEDPNGTDQITTNCNIPDMNTFDLRQNMLESTNLLKLVPSADIPLEDSQTDIFFICYAHGQGSTYNIHGLTDTHYPFGSSGPYDAKGTRLGGKTLSFLFKDLDGQEIGIYDTMWKPFLDDLNQQETATFSFNFNAIEMRRLDLLGSFIVSGTEWLIQKLRRNIPSAGVVEMDCIRI